MTDAIDWPHGTEELVERGLLDRVAECDKDYILVGYSMEFQRRAEWAMAEIPQRIVSGRQPNNVVAQIALAKILLKQRTVESVREGVRILQEVVMPLESADPTRVERQIRSAKRILAEVLASSGGEASEAPEYPDLPWSKEFLKLPDYLRKRLDEAPDDVLLRYSQQAGVAGEDFDSIEAFEVVIEIRQILAKRHPDDLTHQEIIARAERAIARLSKKTADQPVVTSSSTVTPTPTSTSRPAPTPEPVPEPERANFNRSTLRSFFASLAAAAASWETDYTLSGDGWHEIPVDEQDTVEEIFEEFRTQIFGASGKKKKRKGETKEQSKFRKAFDKLTAQVQNQHVINTRAVLRLIDLAETAEIQ